MTPTPGYLITGAGGGLAGVSRLVVEQLLSRGEGVRAMVHRDDSRTDALRALGAEVIVGDLTNPVDVGAAMYGIGRMFFNMSVSADYLEATTVVCAAADDGDGLVPEGGLVLGARRPVDRVLQAAGHRAVVLGRGEEDRVRRAPVLPEPADALRKVAVLEILVVYRQVADPFPQLDLDAGRSQPRRLAHELRVVRLGAKAAGNGQDPHD